MAIQPVHGVCQNSHELYVPIRIFLDVVHLVGVAICGSIENADSIKSVEWQGIFQKKIGRCRTIMKLIPNKFPIQILRKLVQNPAKFDAVYLQGSNIQWKR